MSSPGLCEAVSRWQNTQIRTETRWSVQTGPGKWRKYVLQQELTFKAPCVSKDQKVDIVVLLSY